jgi:hypothetical protein
LTGAAARPAGIYGHRLPSAVMFPIRSVVESRASASPAVVDAGIYTPKPVLYLTWQAALIGTGVGIFGATFQVRSLPRWPRLSPRVSGPALRRPTPAMGWT